MFSQDPAASSAARSSADAVQGVGGQQAGIEGNEEMANLCDDEDSALQRLERRRRLS